MPEGHTVHRIANRFAKEFVGKRLRISSPQGRFASSAALISGQPLGKSYAVGKQMFLEFEGGSTLRIHLGIYGKWKFSTGEANPEVIGQVRARFQADGVTADLRGPTVCEVITPEEVAAVLSRLGPDPINANPKNSEALRFIERAKRSKTPIGQLLMNQDVIAGIGNVYRAELLFRAGIEPHLPGSSLSESQLQSIWDDSVRLLKVGVDTGFMITRDELFKKLPTKDERNWVYKREGQPCRKCGQEVRIELMATRKLYWCPGCQV
jgi:endonuclease-8